MHRNFYPFARRLAATSSRVGTPPRAAEKPRRLAMGLVMLVSGTLFLTMAPSAFASMQLVREWGIEGTSGGQFNASYDVEVAPSGDVYVADLNNHRMLTYSSSGAFLRTWGWGVTDGSNAFQICTSSCQAGIPGAGDGQFNDPRRVAIDAGGNVYVSDSSNNRIEKFSSSGTFLSTWGWGVADGSNAFQVCTSSCQAGIHGSGDGQLWTPQGVAVGSSGNVYVADWNNARVQQFSSSGAFLRTWGWGVDDGSNALQVCTSSCQAGIPGAGDGQFDGPATLTIDSSGVFVADYRNHGSTSSRPLEPSSAPGAGASTTGATPFRSVRVPVRKDLPAPGTASSTACPVWLPIRPETSMSLTGSTIESRSSRGGAGSAPSGEAPALGRGSSPLPMAWLSIPQAQST